MHSKARYYLWNKSSDFGNGFVNNIKYDDGGLYLEDKSQCLGSYFSNVTDSKERGKKWKRVKLDAVWYSNTYITITFFASDILEIDYNGKTYSINKILADNNISFDEKKEIFSEFSYQKFYNVKDIMLQNVEGRYIWFYIMIQGNIEKSPYITQIKLWLDDENWLKFLPEIYSDEKNGADFTVRFLSIFQNLYEEMNDKITMLPELYDINNADRSFLEWLSSWIGLENVEIWSDDKLRKLLSIGADLFSRTGTVGMISEIVEIYTGVKPILIENFFASDSESAVRAWQTKNYNRDPFAFTVMMPINWVKSEEEHKGLIQILNRYKPSHMHMKLIFYQPEWLTEEIKHQTESICLDGRSSLRKR